MTDKEWIELEDKEIVGEYYILYKEKYEGLCELIRGDSPNWTHEEVLEKLELAMDCLVFVENEVDHKEFIDWNIQNKKENGYE